MPTNWKDRNVQYPTRYTITKVGGGTLSSGDTVTMAASPGAITEAGTVVTAAIMNEIEDKLVKLERTTFQIFMSGWRF